MAHWTNLIVQTFFVLLMVNHLETFMQNKKNLGLHVGHQEKLEFSYASMKWYV
jgi:hypothetical protein